MSNLTVRILSAVVLIGVGFSALVLSPYSRWAMITLTLSLGAWEFSRLVNAKFPGPRAAWLCALLAAAFTLPFSPWFTDLLARLAGDPAGFAAGTQAAGLQGMLALRAGVMLLA